MSSKRAIRRKKCKRKQRYTSERAARAGIASLTARKGWQGHLSPYHCKFCGGWHFGHTPAAARRKLGF